MKRWALASFLLVSTLSLAKPPKLTLFISVDSLGTDLMQRNRARFKSGFARLLNEGAVYPSARYEVAECVTAEGHTSMVTGTWPHRTGVVGNKIFNRASGKLEPVFADAQHPVLEAPAAVEDGSPANLLVETLADRLRQATALKGKALSISGKGRSAVAMAGHLGDAWWFHEQAGKFVTGTWYKKEFPTWVKTFNDKKLPDGYHGKKWELMGNAKDYVGTDERPFETDAFGMGKIFPHPLTGGLPSPGPAFYSSLACSPMMDEVMVEFAKAAIAGEELGKDDVPDALFVSFSPIDRTYHLYGPTSWEMQDSLLRLDKALGDLLAAAEKAAGGKQNLLVVLTGDHGGANIPEEWASLGLDGLRVSPVGIQKTVNDEVEKKFGVANVVGAIEEVDVYLDWKAIEAKKADPVAVRRFVAQVLRGMPELQTAVARDDLDQVEPSGLGPVLRNSFHPERSGDVLMVMKPWRVLEIEKAGTSHGTPWSYDSEVPMFLFGKSVKPGYFTNYARPIDLAPTVAAILEMGAPASNEGHVLSEAVQLTK
ncbi:MAG: alkaline phosphatase family protein [Myxococcaceae bacterium]